MRIIFILAFCLPACAYSVMDEVVEDHGTTYETQLPSPNVEEYIPPVQDSDACVPERFASNAIPSDFRLDPSCPPMIYDPPRNIPRWDPGPVITPTQEK